MLSVLLPNGVKSDYCYDFFIKNYGKYDYCYQFFFKNVNCELFLLNIEKTQQKCDLRICFKFLSDKIDINPQKLVIG